MPVRKQDADRALLLLEQYRSKLNKPDDVPLRCAIERVMGIFQSELFHALIDIQEYYELILIETHKQVPANQALDSETHWQRKGSLSSAPTALYSQQNNNVSDKKSRYDMEEIQPRTSASRTQSRSSNRERESTTQYQQPLPSSGETYDVNRQMPLYSFDKIVLEKGNAGLGFSIAGGRDNPLDDNDVSIYITKIIPGGAAERDGRLRANDAIVSVNGFDTSNVLHGDAVNALKLADPTVVLGIRRLAEPPHVDPKDFAEEEHLSSEEHFIDIQLVKGNKGLGFTIAGGVGNQCAPGDNGIFVTKIIPGGASEADGTLRVGDKIMLVDGQSLTEVTHEKAVGILKSTDNIVELRVARQNLEDLHPYILPPSVEAIATSPAMLPAPPRGFGDEPCLDKDLKLSALPPPSDGLLADSRHPLCRNGMDLGTPERHVAASIELEKASSLLERPSDLVLSEDDYLRVSAQTNVPREERVVVLNKTSTGLGFNIVGGDGDVGIFISHIVPGGIADVSGELHKGDHILSVNGIDLTRAGHEEGALALKSPDRTVVDMIVQYKPEEFHRFQEKVQEIREQMMNQSVSSGGSLLLTSQKRTLYVRALFDYDAFRDSGLPSRGLSFHYGDILHVTNASDEEWWQARRVEGGHDSEEFGVIPAKQRVERKERSRLKQVKFSHDRPSLIDSKDSFSHVKRKKSLMFSRKFPFYKSKENLDDFSDQENHVTSNNQSDSETSLKDDVILTYEIVMQKELKYTRPVVVLGPFKDRINDDLLAEYPDKFGSCVPHTTREKRDGEIDGRDYHFVTSREKMEQDIQNQCFIEAGQYNDNLYGTSVQSVKDVAAKGKHCILDVSGNAIKRLQVAGLWPIAIFIRPPSPAWLMELNKRLIEEQAHKIYERAVKQEQEFGEYFTAVVQGETLDQLYNNVKRVIKEQSGPLVWVPSGEDL